MCVCVCVCVCVIHVSAPFFNMNHIAGFSSSNHLSLALKVSELQHTTVNTVYETSVPHHVTVPTETPLLTWYPPGTVSPRMQAEAPGLWVVMGGGSSGPRRALNTEPEEINAPWNGDSDHFQFTLLVFLPVRFAFSSMNRARGRRVRLLAVEASQPRLVRFQSNLAGRRLDADSNGP